MDLGPGLYQRWEQKRYTLSVGCYTLSVGCLGLLCVLCVFLASVPCLVNTAYFAYFQARTVKVGPVLEAGAVTVQIGIITRAARRYGGKRADSRKNGAISCKLASDQTGNFALLFRKKIQFCVVGNFRIGVDGRP